LLSLRGRDFCHAHQLAQEARSAGVADACTFGLMGHALSSLGRHIEASGAYAEALKLGPDDPYVRHLAAAAGIQSNSIRAPLEYVRTVFDGYAERFDDHLVSLGYRVPGLIRAAVLDHPAAAAGRHLGPVLDLGCGTGLVGVVLSDLQVGPFVGVDASSRMLAKAAARQLYAELHERDIAEYLNQTAMPWPIIIAADVFVYFGELRDVLVAVHTRLEPGGWFLFTVEELPSKPEATEQHERNWLLGATGRYSHSMSYLVQAAKEVGFTIRTLRREVLRMEVDAPVAGILAVWERPQ
jgi:predicted TPR repeat methyltransferase